MRLRHALVFFVALSGCTRGSNVRPVDDGAIADGGDAGSTYDASSDGAAPTCPNGEVVAPESCDDGNSVDDDACSNTCRFTALCGNGSVEDGEACDEGDGASGDGCSATCGSESCGNGVLDPGEVCDGATGCAACSFPLCGNGATNAGEQCDDGGASPWDGCGADCLTEKTVVLRALAIAAGGYCDFDLDGTMDNALGDHLPRSLLVDELVTSAIRQQPFVVLSIVGAEDASLTASDANARIAWLAAFDANADATDDFGGLGTFLVDADSLGATSLPLVSLAAAIEGARVDAGPEDVALPFLGGSVIALRRARLVDTRFTVAGGGYSVDSMGGHVCGEIDARSTAMIPNPLAALPGLTLEPCSPDVASANVALVDVLAGGARVFGSLAVVEGTPLDVDVDGDGLERVVVTDGSACQPVVLSCIDGDGTPIAGRDCVFDPRIRDAWSAAFDFEASSASIVGVSAN